MKQKGQIEMEFPRVQLLSIDVGWIELVSDIRAF